MWAGVCGGCGFGRISLLVMPGAGPLVVQIRDFVFGKHGKQILAPSFGLYRAGSGCSVYGKTILTLVPNRRWREGGHIHANTAKLE